MTFVLKYQLNYRCNKKKMFYKHDNNKNNKQKVLTYNKKPKYIFKELKTNYVYVTFTFLNSN